MITSITLNAAIDKVHYINQFQIDKVNRVKEIVLEPGGKGNNVAKVAKLLGSSVIASGFLGGDTGRYIHTALLDKGIASEPVWARGHTREAFNIIDRIGGTQTEILEPGPIIMQEEWEAMRRKVRELAVKSKIVSFSGSLPRGIPMNAYAELIHIAKSEGALTILDSSGESLSRGIESGPFLCKPNRDELAELTGMELITKESIVEAARKILEMDVGMVVVSLDKQGSVVVTNHGISQIQPPDIEAVNTVGCGDALVGGIANFLDRMQSEKPSSEELMEAAAWGTAAAASNARYPIAGHVNLEEFNRMLRQVRVERL
ncbi:1-phosphofructokinase family hexose kinase [Cohnella panacarvi]|uniref:1-phosphofructokinase family hexose kinase n=1 Tax=Cohnella panacarvi TaxID=400776 RepID=UPI000479BF8C|nr:1-phosphofructokinase family hexose kinase [Cohnella panacarvi]